MPMMMTMMPTFQYETSIPCRQQSPQNLLLSEEDCTIVLSANVNEYHADALSTEDEMEEHLFENISRNNIHEDTKYHDSDSSLQHETLFFEDNGGGTPQHPLPAAASSLWNMSVNSDLFEKSLTFSDYYSDEDCQQQYHHNALRKAQLSSSKLTFSRRRSSSRSSSSGSGSGSGSCYSSASVVTFHEEENGEENYPPSEVIPLALYGHMPAKEEDLMDNAKGVSEVNHKEDEYEQQEPQIKQNKTQMDTLAPERDSKPIHCPRIPFSLQHSNDSLKRSPTKTKRAYFANYKPMSVARMELTMDTVIKAHEGPMTDSSKSRRMSFGYVLRQNFDKAAPAAAIVKGCLERLDEWDPKPYLQEKVPSKPSKIKSILKKIQKRLSLTGGGRRGSFFGNKHVQANFPKNPGRRGSFQKASWVLPIVPLPDTVHGSPRKPSRRQSQDGSSVAKRRGSLLDGIARRFSNGGRRFSSHGGNDDNLPPHKPSRRCSQDGAQRRGSFLGGIAQRFSSGGRRFSNNGDERADVSSSKNAVMPPQKPGRRCSQDGVGRDEQHPKSSGGSSLVGIVRRFSSGGRRFSSNGGNNPNAPPQLPGRRCSQTGAGVERGD
eukprot:scaffold4286_cov92-Amphora_coffeaeformis.AAC.6